MSAFTPTLFDRLMGPQSHALSNGLLARLSLEQVKDSVARDLEALLNTRIALSADALAHLPECQNSILNYGLIDFAGFCLTSSDDRAAICASLKAAIERHEPRLRGVAAAIELEAGTVNRLNFVIHATLQVDHASEAVNFNAVLQPSTLHYAISKAQRQHAAGA